MGNTLDRATFTTDRTMEFFSEKELTMQIGTDVHSWGLAIMKELIDNGLDACETANILPEITVEITDDCLMVTDNGKGLPQSVIEKSLDYLIRVSDKNLYVSPSRGQLGNALKCVYAMPFVLNGQYGKVEIQTGGKLHKIEVTVDRIEQKPKIEYNVIDGDFVQIGTFIKIYHQAENIFNNQKNYYSYIMAPGYLLDAYHLFNPHVRFILLYEGDRTVYERKIHEIKKWIPSAPTSSYWYNAERLKSLILGYLSNERNGGQVKTVGDFVSEFRGLTRSSKRKAVIDHMGMQRKNLHDLIINDDLPINTADMILEAMNFFSEELAPAGMKDVGKSHFLEVMPLVKPESIRYKKIEGIAAGMPYIIETAFGLFIDEYSECRSHVITGLNWTPCLSMPIENLISILSDAKVNSFDPAVIAIHIVCPRLNFTDRGKSKLRLPGEMIKDLSAAIESVTKDFTKAKQRASRDGRLRLKQIEELIKHEKPAKISTKDAAYASMEEAYLKASGNNSFPANARQIMYAARPLVQKITGKASPWKASAYFTQTLLPDYINEHPEMTENWDVVYDSRGKLTEPHTNKRVALGTIAVRNYIDQWTDTVHLSDMPNINFSVNTEGPNNRYKFALFIEKEGFDELLKKSKIAERFDLAIMSTKGMSNTASRNLVENLSNRGVSILVLRDLDKAGFSIVHTLKTTGRRYQFNTDPDVIDLGLSLTDAMTMNLEPEEVEYSSEVDPRISIKVTGATDEEAIFLRSAGSPKNWKGQRIELNAMTSPQFIEYLEKKLNSAGVKKVVPCEKTLEKVYRQKHLYEYLRQSLRDAITEYSDETLVIPDNLKELVTGQICNTAVSWDDAIKYLPVHGD